MPAYVLDTSAILTVLYDEPERGSILGLLQDAEAHPDNVTISVPFVALMEVEYRLMRKHLSQARIEASLVRVQSWPVTVRESNEAWRREAARVKGTNQLSLADAWVVSLGLLLDAAVVHKDPEMDRVAGMKSVRL